MEVEIWLRRFLKNNRPSTVFFFLAFDMDKLGKISQLPYKERS